MASDMVLYWGSGSAPCWSAMIVLEEKGLKDYQSHMISFSKKEHKGEDVMKINPRGQVPTFKHGDVVVNESLAIVDYLQALYPSTGTPLVPTEPAALARVLQRKNEAANLRKHCFENYLYLVWTGKINSLTEEEKKEKADGVLTEVGRWESYLKEIGEGAYIAGKEFSMADVMFFPSFALVVRLGLKLESRFPCLQAYYDRVSKHASVQATWPPHWKEDPAKPQFADL